MNKKLVAAALGLAFAAPVFADASNVTLYGRVHQTIVNQKVDNAAGVASPSSFALENNASRLGVRGQEDLGSGLFVVFGYEFGVSADNSTGSGLSAGRHSYVGFKGKYGSFVAGTTDGGNETAAPVYNQAEKYLGSAQNNTGDLGNVGSGPILADPSGIIGSPIARVQRATNSFSYKGNVAGIALSARHALGGSNDVQNSTAGIRENDLRGTEIAADYKFGNLEVGAGYYDVTRTAGSKAAAAATDIDSVFQLGARYVLGNLTIGGLYGQVSMVRPSAAGRDDSNQQFALHGDYKLTGNSGLYALYANSEREDLNAGADQAQMQLTYYYDFSKRTRTYFGFNRNSYDSKVAGAAERDTDSFVLGLRHNF